MNSRPIPRKVFDVFVAMEVQRGLRYQNFISLLLLEIARQTGPDSWLHLERVVRLLSNEIRETDLITTIDSNTVGLVLLYSDKTVAQKVAERLTSRILECLALPALEADPGFRMGGACFPTDATDLKGLLSAAGAMLEHARGQSQSSLCI
jgi:hypothetical protein